MYKVDKKALLKDIETIMNMSDNIARSINHKVIELKGIYREEIDRYTQITGMISGGSGGPPLNIQFELTNKNGAWTVSIPGIPEIDEVIPQEIVQEIVEHITNRVSTVPGIIQMVNFEKDKRKFNLSFEKHTEDYFTGSIKEKVSEKDKQTSQKTSPIKQAGKETKTEDIKTFLTYLLNHEIFYDWVMNEFFENWKSLIDNGCLTTNER